MFNRIVQKRRVIKTGERIVVLLKGPGGEYDTPFDRAFFSGPIRQERRDDCRVCEKAEDVIVPYVWAYGEYDEASDQRVRKNVPAASALEGLLFPMPPDKDCRLLKVLTKPAVEKQDQGLSDGRTPVVLSRELASHKWTRFQRCDPPNPGEVVWTTDHFTVCEGRYEWDPLDWDQTEEVEKGRWVDVNGNPIVVRYWMSPAEEQASKPEPPRLLYRHFEMPELK